MSLVSPLRAKKSAANYSQHCKVQIFVDFTNIVFSRHSAMVMFVHHCPTLALRITELGSINGMDTLHESCHQSWIGCHSYVPLIDKGRLTLQVQGGKPQTGAKPNRSGSVLRSTKSKDPHTVQINKK
jgi:hypothetical protein